MTSTHEHTAGNSQSIAGAKAWPCKLCACCAGLEKDIGGLKREIRERDETIGDKERRIYELKKKNQELEKFKFVLDYKIKELKKQVRFQMVQRACGIARYSRRRRL
jgi:predicted RNase H-like nuclease (RuvC/YqgF family)